MHLDLGGDVEFDWRDDILWRSARPSGGPRESDVWVVEAVTLDSQEYVTPIGTFASSAEAHEALSEAQNDLASMTKSEFEDSYMGSGPQSAI